MLLKKVVEGKYTVFTSKKNKKMPYISNCDVCNKIGIVHAICACTQTHSACAKTGTCKTCKEEFYLESWIEICFQALILGTALGSIIVQHI